MPCQALVRMLAKKPGWKETNFQVIVSVTAADVSLTLWRQCFHNASSEFSLLGDLWLGLTLTVALLIALV